MFWWSVFPTEPTVARQPWQAFRAGDRRVSWSRPWALYTLARWARELDVAIDADTPEGLSEASLAVR
jgi:hypothetical protein